MTTDLRLESRLDALVAEGWAIRERFENSLRDDDFHSFVAADYDTVRAALQLLRAPGRRFLEWGSASGIITIMADLMGFEASGIEIDGSLVGIARELAVRFDSGARFVTGSFLPAGYVRRAAGGDDDPETISEGPSGYLQLGRALDDFDIVFAFPWPGDAPLMLDVMARYGRRDAVMLVYDVNDGVRAYRDRRLLRLDGAGPG
ncbi:MAG: hypothetical protein V4617_09895 [Gemmatimonadota bacterium]